MKKQIITFISIVALVMAPLFAIAGTWTATSSYGPTCYLVNLGGTQQLIGTGVVSGSTFTGFLKYTSSQMAGSQHSLGSSWGYGYSATASLVQCGNNANCAAACGSGSDFEYLNGGSYVYCNADHSATPSVVSVSGLAIISAKPTACW